LRPVSISDAPLLDLAERVPGATFHAARRTLNLTPERVPGTHLPGWVEARLLEAVGRSEPVSSKPAIRLDAS
jgi:hypothetical protein